MKFTFKKQLMATALLACVAGTTNAQTQELSSYQFLEIQGGGLLMSAGGSNKISPTFGLSYGLMSPVVGGRLHINGWQAKGGAYQKWNYALTDLDLLVNLTNLASKKNSHPLNLFFVGGVGLATTWDREKASIYTVDHRLSHNLRAGLRLETNVTKPWGVSLEVDANSMSHHFTGCAANTSNWGFTAMLGVSYRFGKKYTTVSVPEAKVQQTPPQLTRHEMMTGMLKEQMDIWAKRMPNETLEAYQLRVNDETRAAETRKRSYEIATRMAEEMLEASEISLGGYNPNLKKLTVHVKSMPDIFLTVNENEVANLYKNEKNLRLRSKKYTVNPDDRFELVYAEVNEPTQNRTYIFDNMMHESLAYIQEDVNFIEATAMRKTIMEETALSGIAEDVESLAKQENVISDKTHITINTKAEPATDAKGKRVLNYNVGFTYEVEESFTARDDFKPGRYQTNESKAAMLMFQVMKKAFDTDFAKYLAPGKRVKILITGTADATPIVHTLPYDGQYGEYDNQPVYINNKKASVTLNKKDGIATNEQLAFARAIGVQAYIEKEIPALAKTKHDYEYYIEVSKEKGSQYRRINVKYIFEDAF